MSLTAKVLHLYDVQYLVEKTKANLNVTMLIEID